MDTTSSEKVKEQAKGHGVFMVLEVVEILRTAGIICCIASVKALRYYGAARVSSDWEVCVPDSDLAKATRLFDQLGDKYERGDPIFPQLKTLLHTYPRFRSKDYTEVGNAKGFYIVPASEHFLVPLSESIIEFSCQNNIPYPKLETFAQGLVSTQKWIDMSDLVDGMNLNLEWGQTHLYLGEPTQDELSYVRSKNDKFISSCSQLPDVRPQAGRLNDPPVDRMKMWEKIVQKKASRISPHLSHDNWWTQYRRKGSVDPRLREGRAV